jgi:hypothetical protein
MAVTDFQLEFGGVLLGDGTAYDIVAVSGLDDLPDARTSDTPRPSDHGLFPGNDYSGGRTIEMELEVSGATDAAFRSSIASLAAATIPGAAESALVFQLPGFSGARRINCRPRRRSLPVDVAFALRYGVVALQFFATDPRIYADTETELITVAATSGGGRTYPRTYPLTYAAGGVGGTLVATNAGNFPTRPTLTVTGPCNQPRIENVTAGKHLEVAVNLAAGETLVIDTDARTVLLGGTASRYSFLTAASQWWEIAAGDNSLKFTSASNVGTLEVHFRSAWI